jgi:hypothetical protein
MMSEAKSESELRDDFIDNIWAAVRYWGRESRAETSDRKLEGLAFSILNIFDGTSMGFPACDIVLRPHPEDKAYHIQEEEDWIEDGTVINGDCMLHEMWYDRDPKKREVNDEC